MKPAPSLQRRLLALVTGFVLLVWVAIAGLTFLDVRQELDELLDGHLAQAAALLVVQQAGRFEDDDGEAPDAPLLHRYAPQVAFQVFHEGRLVLRSANAPVVPLVAPERHFREGFTKVRLDGEPWRIFAAHGAERDVQVYVGERLHSRGAILWAVLHGTLWPLLVGLPVLALAVWWGVRRGLAPMQRLAQELAGRAPQALEPVAVDGAPAEMQGAVRALNGLFERIGALIDGERRFTADAAHELRTPIAAIRAQAQVALGATDEAGRRHALQSVLAGCDRATRLVEQLLALARVESTGAAAPGPHPELGALARQVLAELAPAAAARGQTLALEAPRPATVAANETLLAALLRNLVDNASRYAGAGAQLRVNVAADGPVLTVEDSGPGLDEADRARLGERFFRVAGSGGSGSGLGWSIVRRIAALHHIDIALDASPDLGGLRVTLRFPGG